MHHIEAAEAEAKLNELLDRVATGEEFIILRQGRAVARLASSIEAGNARDAATAIREMSRGVMLGAVGMRSLIEEGRE